MQYFPPRIEFWQAHKCQPIDALAVRTFMFKPHPVQVCNGGIGRKNQRV